MNEKNFEVLLSKISKSFEKQNEINKVLLFLFIYLFILFGVCYYFDNVLFFKKKIID